MPGLLPGSPGGPSEAWRQNSSMWRQAFLMSTLVSFMALYVAWTISSGNEAPGMARSIWPSQACHCNCSEALAALQQQLGAWQQQQAQQQAQALQQQALALQQQVAPAPPQPEVVVAKCGPGARCARLHAAANSRANSRANSIDRLILLLRQSVQPSGCRLGRGLPSNARVA